MRIHYIRRIRINPKQVKYFKTIEKKNLIQSPELGGVLLILYMRKMKGEKIQSCWLFSEFSFDRIRALYTKVEPVNSADQTAFSVL